MKCARCHRELSKPIMLAGMPLGRACLAAVRTAVHEQELHDSNGQIEPPLFLPLFEQRDLLGDRVD